MTKVVGDPVELEHFAQNLQQFTSDLEGRLTSLQGQFNHLGDTWRDQEHAKFAQEFQQTTQMLHHFIETANAHIPFLRRKAKRLYDFLNQR